MKPPENNYAAEFPEDLAESIDTFEKFCEDGERDMTTKWRNQTFRALLEVWEKSESEWGSSHEVLGYEALALNKQREILMAKSYEVLGYEMLALRNRCEDIMNMMERNRVWPPPVSSWSHMFRAALREVLSRLPQDAFDKVESEVGFILDEPSLKMVALNAPASSPDLSRTIVFLRTNIRLSKEALIGQIAEEIALAFVHDKNDRTAEMLAEKQAREWGFGAELDSRDGENEPLCLVGSGMNSTKSLFRL